MALAKDTQIYNDIFTLTKTLLALTRHFSTDTKPTLARRIESTVLDMADKVVEVNMESAPGARVKGLKELQVLYERLQFLINVSVALRQVSMGQQAHMARMMTPIGKQLVGWRRAEGRKAENTMGSQVSTEL